MRSDEGTYALLLRVAEKGTIEVGALGSLTTRPGRYVYVGSAFGPGGLQARVRRHIRGEGALHWHVDYLRAVATVEEVWYTHDSTRRECLWATVLRNHTDARMPMAGFGASDCDCPAHLVAFKEGPSFAAFRQHIQGCQFDHDPIERIAPRALRED